MTTNIIVNKLNKGDVVSGTLPCTGFYWWQRQGEAGKGWHGPFATQRQALDAADRNEGMRYAILTKAERLAIKAEAARRLALTPIGTVTEVMDVPSLDKPSGPITALVKQVEALAVQPTVNGRRVQRKRNKPADLAADLAATFLRMGQELLDVSLDRTKSSQQVKSAVEKLKTQYESNETESIRDLMSGILAMKEEPIQAELEYESFDLSATA